VGFNIKNPFNVSFVDLAFDGMCFENTLPVTSYLKCSLVDGRLNYVVGEARE